MRVLAVNAGSSSLKVSLLDPEDEPDPRLESRELDDWDGSDLSAVSDLISGASAVAHRVVHGGRSFTGPARIDDSVMAAMEDLAPLAPLHQHRCLDAIRAANAAAPSLPAVACFDTAFHHTIPEAAATYAIPAAWRDLGVRRFGFHGLSHAWASRTAATELGIAPHQTQLVTAHLGAGASLCAVRDGRSVDTTMGFTPLEGLVMATRSGSVDPGALLWLANEHGIDAADMADALERRSGLAGLVADNPGGDLRGVITAADAGDEAAALAYEVYVHRIRSGIAAMAASLTRLDAVVFTGGVGENSDRVRSDVAAGLSILGVGDKVPVLVVAAGEDRQMATEARGLLGGSS